MSIKRLFRPSSSKGLRVFKVILKIALIIILTLILAFIVFYLWGSSGTVPRETYSEIISYTPGNRISPGFASSSPDSEKNNEFTLMTYNIGYLSGMSNNLPVRVEKQTYEAHTEQFLNLVKLTQPDFIGFQEIDFNSHRSHNIDQLKRIAEGADYPFGAKAITWDKHYVPFPSGSLRTHFKRMLSGQAVLSRFPIISTERVVFKKPEENAFYYNAFYTDRLAQVVKVRVKENVLVLINVHLEAFRQKTREKQAEAVLNLFRIYDKDYPVLLLGDFNCVPPEASKKMNFYDEPETDFTTDRTISIILGKQSSGNADYHKTSLPGNNNSKIPVLKAAEMSILTFPANEPNRKLDYIFYNPEKIECLTVFAPQISSSDHLPLIVKFRLKNTKSDSPMPMENKEK